MNARVANFSLHVVMTEMMSATKAMMAAPMASASLVQRVRLPCWQSVRFLTGADDALCAEQASVLLV